MSTLVKKKKTNGAEFSQGAVTPDRTNRGKVIAFRILFPSTQALENGHRSVDVICTHNKYHSPSWPVNRKFITGTSGIAHNAVTSNTN